MFWAGSSSSRGVKVSRKVIILLALFALTLIAFSINLIFTSGEIQNSEFATFSEAKSSGYLAKGWIPKCLPDSSRSIFEQHDLDTNKVWIKFSYDPKDEDVIRSIISKTQDDLKTFDSSKKGAPKWWEIEELPEANVYSLNKTADCGYFQKNTRLFIDWQKGIVYFWCSGS
jgi:hypothetical protein